MKKFLMITLSLILSSCATIKDHNTKVDFPNKPMNISIHKLSGGNPNTLAYAEIQGDVCRVYLRQYPKCLQHEIRHCFEGNWHEGRKSDEFC